MKPICVGTRGTAFGDKLLAGYVCAVLNDNEVEACVPGNKGFYKKLDVPYRVGKYKDQEVQGWRMKFRDQINNTGVCNIVLGNLKMLEKRVGRDLPLTRNFIPVKYRDLPEIASVDVALCTKCGYFSKYREWDKFSKLKEMMQAKRISWIDLSEKKIKNVAALNVVNKAKLYVGIETGMSHYVSHFANGKTLIIQSGFAPFSYWCNYDYEKIEFPTSCAPCWKTSNKGCPHGHKCMKKIGVEQVMNWILRKL